MVSEAPRLRQSRLVPKALPALACLWLLIVCAGMTFLSGYSKAPGELTSPPSTWPVESSIQRNRDGATLLVFLHPHCSCSRATLGELERLLTQSQELSEAFVVFLKPGQFESGWEKTDLWRRSVQIPGVTAIVDEGTTECRLFCAKTSGLTLLYDERGALQFHGGITSSRSHEGDNAGRSAILSLLHGGKSPLAHTAVFGCGLQNPRSGQRDE